MPTVTQHSTGTFCWIECATPDPAATKKFYSDLLGWGWRDVPMGEGGTYHIAELGGAEVAAMYQLSDEMKSQGVPPNWGTYVRVESADAAAKQAASLGGKVLMEPFDVMEHGRMAVLMDPIGAVFSVWQENKHIGVQKLNEPGSFGWAQLNATDPAKAKPFYTGLFGWTVQDDANPMGGVYTTWLKSDGPAGGMMGMPPGAEGAPSHWLVYWTVADTRASHAKAESLGAKTFVPPMDIPGMLTFSVLQDPQGVVFALMTPMMG
jgi:predicted enzyme related to lactoylglutathione lyase